MTEGEEGEEDEAKARRSSPSVDRNVRGENVHSLASQQRPASIECTAIALPPQTFRRSNEPALDMGVATTLRDTLDSSIPARTIDSDQLRRWCHERPR